MRSRRATIKDVAREAGVSVTTVSVALNGKGRVGAETRQIIEEVAQRLKYSASRTAANLTSGRTGTLVFAVSPMTVEQGGDGELPLEWDVDYYFQVFNAASAEAFGHNFLLAMLPFHGPSNSFLNTADGLILVDPNDDDPLLDDVISRDVPCVTIGRNNRGLNWVDNDFFAATSSAINHLTSSVPARPALFLSETSSSYVRDEISAYLDWCSNMSFDPAIVRSPSPRVDEAEPVIRQALQSPDRRFDSILTTLDTLALAADQASRRLGIGVPEDMQILSLADSRYLSHNLQTSITALDLCPIETAKVAINMLIDGMNNGQAHLSEIVPTSLKVRSSTRKPGVAFDSPNVSASDET